VTAFADTSALVKLYVDEPGRELVRGISALTVSAICRVEIPAALWRKHRLGELELADVADLLAEFDADYFGDKEEPPRFAAVRVTDEVLESAARAAAAHGLRAYDAVQLSSAIIARDVDPGCTEYAAFDQELRTAAAAEGFALIPS
jgi:predicted nucleic acid-binding protein